MLIIFISIINRLAVISSDSIIGSNLHFSERVSSYFSVLDFEKIIDINRITHVPLREGVIGVIKNHRKLNKIGIDFEVITFI